MTGMRMTGPRRVSGVAATAVTLAAAAAATLGTTANVADAASGVAPAAAPAHTTLHVHVGGCSRCTIQLQHAIDGAGSVWTSRQRTVGKDHMVDFDVRTARTSGLSFVVRAPWAGNTGAVINMVTRYAGDKVGSQVGSEEARHSRRAEGCWAGTASRQARVDFHVVRVAARTPDGHRTHIPLAYATPALPSTKPMLKTYKGTLGNQDAFYCKP
jgi:hypothetical protein